MIRYAKDARINYAGITDGDQWELYDISRRGALQEKRILDLQISASPPYQTALNLLLLWRPNLSSAQPAQARKTIAAVPPADNPAPPAPGPKSWVSLAKFVIHKGAKCPKSIRFLDRTECPIHHWYQLVLRTVQWLWSNEMLTEDNISDFSTKSRHLVHTKATHPSGKDFVNPKCIARGPVYISKPIGVPLIPSRRRKSYCNVAVNPPHLCSWRNSQDCPLLLRPLPRRPRPQQRRPRPRPARRSRHPRRPLPSPPSQSSSSNFSCPRPRANPPTLIPASLPSLSAPPAPSPTCASPAPGATPSPPAASCSSPPSRQHPPPHRRHRRPPQRLRRRPCPPHPRPPRRTGRQNRSPLPAGPRRRQTRLHPPLPPQRPPHRPRRPAPLPRRPGRPPGRLIQKVHTSNRPNRARRAQIAPPPTITAHPSNPPKSQFRHTPSKTQSTFHHRPMLSRPFP